jgi:hypothetical protein
MVRLRLKTSHTHVVDAGVNVSLSLIGHEIFSNATENKPNFYMLTK